MGISQPGGTGNVVGPATSVNGDLAIFSGTTGRLLQDSGISSVGVGLLNVQVFTSSGIYTPTPGTNRIVVKVQAQGGGGGGAGAAGATQNAVGGSGGGGAYAEVYYATGFSGAAVTIGTTGAGGTAGANNGTPGGTASFILAGGGNASVTCPGGPAGAGGAPFTATSGSIGASPTLGGAAPTIINGTTLVSAPGGASGPGIGLGVLNQVYSSTGGASALGQGGLSAIQGGAGANGLGFGGAGSGGTSANSSATAGGNPAPGVVIVWEYR